MTHSPERTFTIRQLCNEFGVTARALRFYEDKGLLSPERNGLNRVYSVRDRARLLLIVRGKKVGFSLSEIGEMLDLYDEDEMHAAQMATSLAKFRQRIKALEAQRVEIQLAIDGLRTACSGMEARLAQVRPDLLQDLNEKDSPRDRRTGESRPSAGANP